MKLRHFAVFGGIFTVIICLLLFLFIVTADDEESGSSSLDFSGLNLSAEVLKHQSTVEKYAKEYRISDYVNYLLAIMQVESGGTGTTDVMQASESLGLPLNSLSVEDSIKQGCKYFSELLKSAEAKGCDINTVVQSDNRLSTRSEPSVSISDSPYCKSSHGCFTCMENRLSLIKSTLSFPLLLESGSTIFVPIDNAELLISAEKSLILLI